MARYRNANWNLPGNDTDKEVPYERVMQALLMDIRDELKQLNAVFSCHNFQRIPATLEKIVENTKKPKRNRIRKATHAAQ